MTSDAINFGLILLDSFPLSALRCLLSSATVKALLFVSGVKAQGKNIS